MADSELKEKNLEEYRYFGTEYIHLGSLNLTDYIKLCQLIGTKVNILAWRPNEINDEEILDIVVDRRDTSEEVIRTLMNFFKMFFED